MITTAGLRNAFWCTIALVIVACASAPMPMEKRDAAQAAAAVSNETAVIPAGTGSGN